MKIGLITNLVNIERFVATQLIYASTDEWMVATGGNTGNVAFVTGVQTLLGGNYKLVGWGDDPVLVNKHFDHLVVCCANQIGAHVDLSGWADRLRHFDLPTTFIGLGAQADSIGSIPDIPEGSQQFIALTKALRSHPQHPNVITRGQFSSDVLAHYGIDSSPFGCPSQFISLERGLGQRCYRHQQRARFPRIMTAAGNPWHRSASLENMLTDIVERYHGDYILQHPQALLQLALGEAGAINLEHIEHFEKIYSRIGDWEAIKAWFESYAVFFADAQNWMHYARHFTMAIGPRYHGVALPIQAGVPGKVISIDSRTEELATTTGIPTLPYRAVESMDAEALIDACRWQQDDATHYDNTRQKNAQHYMAFLSANGLPCHPRLEKLAQVDSE